MSHILSVDHVIKRFDGLTAVDRCSFSVGQNSITALIGPNGAGKTTMFNVISGFIDHDAGNIKFRGQTLNGMLPHRRARLGIGRTFQSIRLFPKLTAAENLMLAFPDFHDGFFSILKPFRKTHRQFAHRTNELLAAVKLDDKAHHLAGSLSYGQQKLLEIMRAVATGADFLLLDEPAAGVNRTMLNSIITLIQKLKQDGKTIMIVEHDMGFVMNLSDHVIVMDFGKTIAEGTPNEVQKNPKVLEAYLGVKK